MFLKMLSNLILRSLNLAQDRSSSLKGLKSLCMLVYVLNCSFTLVVDIWIKLFIKIHTKSYDGSILYFIS